MTVRPVPTATRPAPSAATLEAHSPDRLDRLEEAGIRPYPHRFDRTHTTDQVREAYGHLATGERSGEKVRVAGRVAAVRDHAATVFLDLRDAEGRLQAALPGMGSDDHPGAAPPLTRGDWIGVCGRVGRTRTGELTVFAERTELLAPCLRPLPDSTHGLRDPGVARTQRHLHLAVDPEALARFRLRGRVVRELRAFFWARGFEEVETAILDDAYGGAEARPFTTACNAVERDLYLRISPELPLKELIVGGFDRVFEVGKQFRNEGLSARHHPEFTSVEAYAAHLDYGDMMALAEELFAHLADALLGDRRVVCRLGGEAVAVDLTPPFRRVTLFGALAQATGRDFAALDDGGARAAAAALGVAVGSTATADEVALAAFEKIVEPTLREPTFVLDYPASLCPLTKRHRSDPRLAERFELYLGGVEFANAYSELTDPREQRAHFAAQADRRARGDDEAHLPDWGFVEALELGMPPTGGLGIGIDRLAMLFCGASHIRDVILFPLRRAGSNAEGEG